MLKALPGVEQVRAQAGKQRIDVLYDEAKQESSEIAEHLGAAGYQTRFAGSDPKSGSGN